MPPDLAHASYRPTGQAVNDLGQVVVWGYDVSAANGIRALLVDVQPKADLSVRVTGTPDPSTVTSPLTYTVTIANAGPDAATSVVATDVLPATLLTGVIGGSTFGTVTASQGACAGTRTISCNLGSLAAGASATIVMTATSSVAASLMNTISVSSAVSDPVAGNNTAGVTTTVLSAGGAAQQLLNTLLAVTSNKAPTSMRAALQNVSDKLASGNLNAAIGELNAFMNAVSAQAGKSTVLSFSDGHTDPHGPESRHDAEGTRGRQPGIPGADHGAESDDRQPDGHIVRAGHVAACRRRGARSDGREQDVRAERSDDVHRRGERRHVAAAALAGGQRLDGCTNRRSPPRRAPPSSRRRRRSGK